MNKCNSCGYINFEKDKICRGCGKVLRDSISPGSATMHPKGGIKLSGASCSKNPDIETKGKFAISANGGMKFKGTSSGSVREIRDSAENKNDSMKGIKFNSRYRKNSTAESIPLESPRYCDDAHSLLKKTESVMRSRWLLAAVMICVVVSLIFLFRMTNSHGADSDTDAVRTYASYIAEREISTLLSSEEIKNADMETQKKLVEEELTELSNQGSISDYIYEENVQLYSFEYSNGVLGGVSLKDYDESTNLAGVKSENGSTSYVTSVSDTGFLLLNAFENSESRRTYYSDFISKWNNKGVNVKYDIDVTVDDLKQLGQYEIVILAMHGSIYRKTPVLCINQSVTKSTDEEYREELSSNQIAKVTSSSGEVHYWIFPQFFSGCYPSGTLYGCFIYSESCDFFGSDEASSTLDTSFSDAFMRASARGVCGCRNSVYATYSREIMSSVVEDVFYGQHPDDALEKAKSIFGDSDGYAYPVCFADDAQFDKTKTASQQVYGVEYDALNTYKYMLLVNEFDGAVLQLPNNQFTEAEYFYLFDMNSDDIDELLIYGMDGGNTLVFKLYTYRNGEPVLLADSIGTCDISEWWNAALSLIVYDGRYLSVCAHGTTVAAAGTSSLNLFSYDGNSVIKEKKEKPESYTYCVDLLNAENGIPIETAEEYFDAIMDGLGE